MLNPTVPKAEITSNNTVVYGVCGLSILTIRETLKTNIVAQSVIVTAIFKVLFEIDRLNMEGCVSFFSVLVMNNRVKTKLVTLIPPAALIGAPPININSIIIIEVGAVICPMSTVLNPAVRVVTDWKNEAPIFSGSDK